VGEGEKESAIRFLAISKISLPVSTCRETEKFGGASGELRTVELGADDGTKMHHACIISIKQTGQDCEAHRDQ
jgi:hypothetical protein